MEYIDRNIATKSLEEALVPKGSLLDGRTEEDRLRFLVDFASVINFYNEKNETHENWAPILLKDPVFLLATISKTNMEDHYRIFRKIRDVSYIIDDKDFDKEKATQLLDQLFVQIIDVFLVIERWTVYMQNTDIDYHLKKYVLKEVAEKYSIDFWAVIELHRLLRNAKLISGTSKKLHFIDDIELNPIWVESKSNASFKNVLGLQDIIAKDQYELSKEDEKHNFRLYFNALVNVGDRIFAFFKRMIDHAVIEYENESIHKDEFPDTLLLRAFTNLMMVHQDQLNSLANKHLDFYYFDILKQERLGAQPDNVFITAETTKKDSILSLPEGTLFAAGISPNQELINFKSINKVEINPANILNSYTLIRNNSHENYSTLHLEHIIEPGKLKKDEDGITKPWSSFGALNLGVENQVSLGLALSSPMFYLKEGTRDIDLIFTFSELEDVNIFDGCTFFFSSQMEWLDITEMVKIKPHKINYGRQKFLSIALDKAFPPIEKFNAEAGKVESEWPLLKIVFSQYVNIGKPPVVDKIDIKVSVKGVQKLALHNDFGGLDPKAPFQVFGPTAVKGSNFFIGSNEVMSKPLDELIVNVEWDELPENLATYYKAYNDYIKALKLDAEESKSAEDPKDDKDANGGDNGNGGVTDDTDGGDPDEDKVDDIEAAKGFLSKFKFGKQILKLIEPITALLKKSSFGKAILEKFNLKYLGSLFAFIPKIITPRILLILGVLKNLLFKKKDDDPDPEKAIDYRLFSNESFRVGMNFLTDGIWQKAGFNSSALSDTNPNETDAPISSTTDVELKYASLFSATEDSKAIEPTSNLISQTFNTEQGFVPDSSLQKENLIFSEENKSGFVRLTLDGPKYGFGSQLYPEVVSDVALKNAVVVSKKDPKLEDLLPTPLPPFILKVKKIDVDYTSSHTYFFMEEDNSYPLECFYFTPFKDYLIYDDTNNVSENKRLLNSSLGSNVISDAILPIIPSFQYSGGMFIELENLIYPGKLNLYFEVVQNVNFSEEDEDSLIEYRYLSKTGWRSLSVVSDSTNGFSCSGIVTVKIPDDITDSFHTMPLGKYWIFFGVNDKGNPNSFPQTVLLKVNGVELSRAEAYTLNSSTKPYLKSKTIVSTTEKVPNLGDISQPFPSFGGKPEESDIHMHRRISSRIKTKNRLVSQEDIYSVVLDNYPTIYSVRSHYDKTSNKMKVHAVPKIESWQAANAFLPLITKCLKIEIKSTISEMCSAFVQVEVSNFELVPVTVIANVDVAVGYGELEVKKNINHLLNIYLSPWIKSDHEQLPIGKVLKASDLTSYVKSIEGVANVVGLGLSYGDLLSESTVGFTDPSKLIISSLNHIIS